MVQTRRRKKKGPPRGRRATPKVPNLGLAAARQARGWSRPELARRTGMSAAWILQMEQTNRIPKLDDARAVSAELRVSMDVLWPPKNDRKRTKAAA